MFSVSKMLTHLSVVLVATQLRVCLNFPLSHFVKRSALDLRKPPQLPTTIVPAIAILQPQNIALLTPNARKKKSPYIPLSLPIPHQLLVPNKLHVIPARSNMHHSSIHTDIKHIVTKDNVKIPIVTHTVVNSVTNITHPTPLVPILIPVHTNQLVPVHDLTVIPLHSVRKTEPKVAHLRAALENGNEDMSSNRYRNIFGGFGTGLFFGGHGAGHGFYAYG